AGPRALLKARMAQMQAGDRGVRIPGFPLWFAPAMWSAFLLAGALVLLGVFVLPSWLARKGDRASRPGAAVVTVPDPSLTPGATMLVSREQVCKASNSNNRMVPATLQRQVFEEYGIGRAEPHAYEVDYLITPALGGADDIHNLWPESYEATVWNARVKDALEAHLRDMVCGGQLDLMTAQREIAMNWIEAYKKYFHTDRPLTR
ncbi:MAG TPA: hypothetical protein VHC72_12260, partial [Bryobacteraceae bacterium]|nr:hypothetical protein [Bryobacteraceae bacterium]